MLTTRFPSPAPLLPRTPGQLAWAPCWRTVRNGFLYLLVLLVLAVAGAFAWASWRRVPADYHWLSAAGMSPWYLLLAALAPAAAQQGAPAVGSALLWVPAMRLLFTWGRRSPRPLAGALLGTAAGFEAVVLLSAAALMANSPALLAHGGLFCAGQPALAATWSRCHELPAAPAGAPTAHP